MPEASKIKIFFEGFWDGFDYENNFITNILRKYYDISISKDPDYLFYSIFNDNYLKYDCVKIFFTGENISPDFNLCDFAIAYDDISFGDRYLRFPLWLLYNQHFTKEKNNNEWITVLKRIENDGNRKKFCSFVYSNGKADPFRECLLDKISEYKCVDSGGKYKNNVGGPVKDKIAFESEYAFSIACENVSQEGYTTEKIVEAFVAGTIPIYWGDPDITKDFNERAFINCNKYNSTEEIIKDIKHINENDELYKNMIEQPVFLKANYIDEKYRELEQFLTHIVELPYEKAKKNTKYYWKKIYQTKIVQGTFVFGAIDKIKMFVGKK